jgi:hypothetical protein
MKRCSRDGCWQWTPGDEEFCTYDAKIRDGLIVPDSQVYGRRWSAPRPKRMQPTIAPSDVVTDEQLELGNLMRRMGATEHVIARAMQRETRMPIGTGKRGTGVKRGRLVV